MGLGNRAKDKMLGNLIPASDDNTEIKVRRKNKNQEVQNDIKALQAKAFIQKNWKLSVELAFRLRKYVQAQKEQTPEITEIQIVTEIFDDYLKTRGF